MWRQIFDLVKTFFTAADKLQRLENKVMEHSEYIRNLSETQARMYYEAQLQRERDARVQEREREREKYEREKEALQLENQQLRARLERSKRRSLPPAPPDKKRTKKMKRTKSK